MEDVTINLSISTSSVLIISIIIVSLYSLVPYYFKKFVKHNLSVSPSVKLSKSINNSYVSSSDTDTTKYHIVKQPSYRIEEEINKKSSVEYTRRGQLWSKRASWKLSKVPRERYISVDNHIQGIEQIKSILNKYDVDIIRGFLTTKDPLQRLPYARYHLWEDLADDLPKLLGARLGQAREPLKDIPILSTDKLVTHADLRRAHLLLSLFAHAYIFGGNEPLDILPEGIAVPLWEVSKMLDIPPILGHPSIVLYNWRRLDEGAEICMENLSTLNNFFDGRDESWFYLITVEIEAKGAASIAPLMLSIDAIQRYLEEKKNTPIVGVITTTSSSLSNIPNNNNKQSCSQYQIQSSSECDNSQVVMDDLSDVTPDNDQLFSSAGIWLDEPNILSPHNNNNNNIEDNHACNAEYEALLGELSLERTCDYVTKQLLKIANAIQAMTDSINCMKEGCHPFIFYHRVRPFLSGWKHNNTLPEGIYKSSLYTYNYFYSFKNNIIIR